MQAAAEREQLDALYRKGVCMIKQTETNALQICKLSLEECKRVYKKWMSTRKTGPRVLCPLCMKNDMGLGNQKCTACQF